MEGQNRPIRGKGAFALLIGASLLIFGGLGYVYYHKAQADLLIAEREHLDTVAKTKASQAALWYDEFRSQAEAIRSNPMVVNRVRGLLADPKDREARQDLVDWIGLLRKLHDCRSVYLLDPGGNPILTLPEGREPFDVSQEAAFSTALRSKQVTVSDLHRGSVDKVVHLSFNIPIGGKPGPDSFADGVLRIQVDPYEHLFPLLQQWPTSSPTAEVVLARREGNEVVYLNELRHRKDTALKLRLPIDSRTNLPAAMAALGREGIVDGKDYRGVRVLASMRAVPGTPWFLVAKVDLDEMYAALRLQAWAIGLTAIALALATSMGGGLLWRYRDSQRLRCELAAEQERQGLALRVLHLNKYANDIILLMDAKWRILEANDRAVETYGYSLEELKGMTIRDLRTPETQSAFDQQITHLRNTPGTVFEATHRTKAGKVFPVEVSARIIELHGIQYYQSFIRDITERKRADLERETTIQFLSLVNVSVTKGDLIHTAVRFFQGQSGCEAVGIRLKDEDDYPYFEVNGFSPEFVQAERQLCIRDAEGELPRDTNGNPVLECMCGNVICGRFDPSKPFFTQHGSFWTNSTTKLLATTSEADRQARTRNRCAGEGYESVALMPLSVGTERLGLLQLNDGRKDCFTPETIALWERLAGYLAVALAKMQAEDELRESKERLSLATEAASLGTYSYDHATGLSRYSPEFLALYGLRPDEMLPLRPDQTPVALIDEDRSAFLAAVAEGTDPAGDGLMQVEFRIRRPDGAIRWLMTRGRLSFVGPAGSRHPVRAAGVIMDITDRKSAQRKFELQHAMLNAVIESSDDAIFALDGNYCYTMFNSSHAQVMKSLFGKEIKLGASILDCHPPDERVMAQMNLDRSLGGKSVRVEGYIGDGGLGQRYYSISHNPIHAASGEVAGVAVFARDLTDRKRAEDALRKSEEKFAKAFHMSPDAVNITRMEDGVYLHVNDGFIRNMGYTRQEVLGQSSLGGGLKLWVNPEDRSRLVAGLKERGEYVDLEADFRRKDGTIVSGTMSAKVIEIEGTPCILSIMRDITERKRAEAALLESERFAHATVDALSAHLAILDENGMIIAVNRAWRAFAQANSDGTANLNEGASYLDVCDWAHGPDSEEAAAFAAGIRSVLRGEQAEFTLEYPCHCANEKRWFIGRVTPFPGEGVSRFVVVHENITERKLAEMALRESEQRLLLAQRAGRVGVFDLDIQSGRTVWTSELEYIFGLPRGGFEGHHRDWAKRVVPEDLARLEVLFQEWFNSDREVEEWEYRIAHRDGQEHWIAGRAQVIRDSAGKAVRMIGTNRDITGRKRAERRLLVHQEQLRGLARRLVTAEEQERRRIAVDFHDQIGQNAASLRLSLQLLRKARLSEEESLVLQESLALLKQMCDDSRTLAFELCSPLLYEIGLGAAISSLGETISQQHHVHVYVEGGHLGTGLRDDLGAALYQVARELLRNAIRHGKASNLHVSISEGSEIRIVVRDDGIGFDATHRESCGQGEPGFGLFGIRERLRLYGGRLEILSQGGQGTVAMAVVPQGAGN